MHTTENVYKVNKFTRKGKQVYYYAVA